MKFKESSPSNVPEKVIETPKKTISKKTTDGAPKSQGNDGEKCKKDNKEEDAKKR